MKYILLFMIVFVSDVNAQSLKPLDSIPQEKKALLLKFGDFFNVETLSETTMSALKKTIDKSQRNAIPGFYKVLDFKADTLKKIPIEVIHSLNKKEFSLYILAMYSKILTIEDLNLLNAAAKTDDGKRALGYFRDVIKNKTQKEVQSSIFSDIKIYDLFLSLHNKSLFVYDNIVPAYFLYIDEKVEAFNHKKN